MATVYSQRLAAGFSTSAGAVTIYTVPVGKLVVLRDIVLLQNGGTSGQLSAYMGLSGGAVAMVYSIPTSVVSQTFEWQGRQIMYAGETLHAYASGSGGVQYLVSGYIFDAV